MKFTFVHRIMVSDIWFDKKKTYIISWKGNKGEFTMHENIHQGVDCSEWRRDMDAEGRIYRSRANLTSNTRVIPNPA